MALSAEQQRAIATAKARQRQQAQVVEQAQVAEQAQPISPQIQLLSSVLGDKIGRADQIFKQATSQGLPEPEAIRLAIEGQRPIEEQRQVVAGLPSAALTLGSSFVSEPAAGITGLATSLIPGLEEGSGAGVAEGVRKRLTIPAFGESGKAATKAIAETLDPSLGAIMRGTKAAGEFTQDVTGSPLAATAVETGLAAIPELLSARAGFKKPAAQRVDVPEPKQVATARQASESTGIGLFEGQQTLSAPALERQSFVSQLPSGVQKASKELELQNTQASRAVDDILAQIAPDESIFTGAERFRSASKRALQREVDIRKEKTSPLYNDAFGSPVDVNTSGIVDRIADISDKFPPTGEVSKSLAKVEEFIGGQTNLERLHNAKVEIDQLISKVGEGSIGNTTKGKLKEIQELLLSRMDETNPKYKAARERFAELSGPVKALEDSIIGKVAGLDDIQLKGLSRSIFDAQNVNTRIVSDARKIISEVDPDAWNMLFRAEIERRMGSIKPELGGAIENIPGKLSNAIFGSTRNRNVLLAGASGETKKALMSLDVALRRAGLGRDRGSQTASRTEVSKELRGGVVSGLRDLFRSPLDTIIRTGEDANFDRRVSAMTEALFDPKYKAETAKMINSNRGRDLSRLILSIEALKASERQETEEQEL